jgi:integrase
MTENVAPVTPLERSCDHVFDDFLAYCESRMAMKDLSFATYNGYRKLLAQIWRPKIGGKFFFEVRYSELVSVVSAYRWSKKTYNNAVSALRCAFDFGYRDMPEKHNPAESLMCLRITKKDRPAVDPFTLQEAEALISRLHSDWGEAIGNYDEFRFFTGLRPSEEIALVVGDYDLRKRIVAVTKARVLRRDKDRTKTGVDRDVDLCPRAVAILERHLELRREYVAHSKIRHDLLFFLEDGSPISDPEVTRRRWNESLQSLKIRQRGPYQARHTSVTWNLMIGKNLLWVSKQHGHSVQVMLDKYAAWLEGVTSEDIEAIKRAMESRGSATTAQMNASIVRTSPLQSPEFGTDLALAKSRNSVSAGNSSKKRWRRGWDSNPRAGITRPSDFESAPL